MTSPAHAHIAAVASLIRDLLGDDCDDATLADTLEGETDLMEVVDALLEADAEARALADAVKQREAELAERRRRIEARSAAARRGMLELLNASGLLKIERPAGTVSRLKGRARVQITDEDAVPTQLCRVVKHPDKGAIKKALEAGEDVPGAELVMGSDTVSVRVR